MSENRLFQGRHLRVVLSLHQRMHLYRDINSPEFTKACADTRDNTV